MTRRTVIFSVIGILLVVGAFGAYRLLQLRSLTQFPTAEEAGLSFQTIQSGRPEGSRCLNEAPSVGMASRNENSAAVFVSSPRSLPPTMVVIDRDEPGHAQGGDAYHVAEQ